MKVVKRDGKFVDYESDKIRIAIGKANAEVEESMRATEKEITSIIKYIESLDRKRILVEDIQDIIEEKLMSLGHYLLAKKYIVYRYTRALVRKKNASDESILNLLQRTNRDALEESTKKRASEISVQRNLIASEVSKDLTKRILLPEKIVRAEEEGILYFHAKEYFIQPMLNSSYIHIGNMLEEGTVLNGVKIVSPKSFQVASTILPQIVSEVSNGQYGEVYLNILELAPYLRESEKNIRTKYKNFLAVEKEILGEIIKERLKKELRSGVQTLLYQLNTLMTSKGVRPNVTFFLSLDENSSYREEQIMIMEELLTQKAVGIQNEDGEFEIPEYPKFIYGLNENNNLTGGKYDFLTKKVLECMEKGSSITFLSEKKMKELFSHIFSPMNDGIFLDPWVETKKEILFEGRSHQGTVTLNLPHIAILSEKEEEKFFAILKEKLDLCYEALMCKHYALLGTPAFVSPIHFRYGALARLEKEEKIDQLLKGRTSALSLGYIGLNEMTEFMEKGSDFTFQVLSFLREACKRFEEESGIKFLLSAMEDPILSSNFLTIDKEKYGIIKGVTNKESYSNFSSFKDPMERLSTDSKIQEISMGGFLSKMGIDLKKESLVREVLSYVYENMLVIELKKKEG